MRDNVTSSQARVDATTDQWVAGDAKAAQDSAEAERADAEHEVPDSKNSFFKILKDLERRSERAMLGEA